MWKLNSQKAKLFVAILLLQPLLSPGSFAHAKRKRPPKAFSFIVMGGKASQGECDGEWKIPRKLKQLKEVSKAGSYIGSELDDPEIKSKNNEEMWKHFFRDKGTCNSVLAKTPSSLNDSQKSNKPVLPPDDTADSEQDADKAERSVSE